MKKTLLLFTLALLGHQATRAQLIPILNTVLPSQVQNMSQGGITNTTQVILQNRGLTDLQFYTAPTGTSAPLNGLLSTAGVVVKAGTTIFTNVQQLGGTTVGNFINVQNLNTLVQNLAGTFVGTVLQAGAGFLPKLPPVISSPNGCGQPVPPDLFQIDPNNNLYLCPFYNINDLHLPNSLTVTNVSASGVIGIGTPADPNYTLKVNGSILAKSVDVRTNWSDFVFAKNYTLMNLGELEQYIQAHKHLPEIPTEAEVEDKGANVGDMLKLQMQKIEELTLYVIEQNKKLETQQKEIDALKKQGK